MTPSIAICVATYERPEGLRTLLQSLSNLETGGLTVCTVVIDNEGIPSPSTDVVEEMADSVPNLIYRQERCKGTPFARNHAIAVATELGADFVAFVDDDEWVAPGWLLSLHGAATQFRADVVEGPVVPSYPDAMPAWAIDGNFLSQPRFRTGTPLRHLATNNLLMRRSVLDDLPGPFDEKFLLGVGEDTCLGEKLLRSGVSMVWCDEAIVWETVPKARGTVRWVVKRAYRGGKSFAWCMIINEPSKVQLLNRALRSAARLGYGVLRLGPSLVGGRVATVQALQHCAVGAGGLAGIMSGFKRGK